MPLAVANALGADRVRTGYKLLSVEAGKEGGYVARFDTPKGRRRVKCKAIAVTAPAHVVNNLLRPLVPEVGRWVGVGGWGEGGLCDTGIYQPGVGVSVDPPPTT